MKKVLALKMSAVNNEAALTYPLEISDEQDADQRALKLENPCQIFILAGVVTSF